jgi:hypothetical protein
MSTDTNPPPLMTLEGLAAEELRLVQTAEARLGHTYLMAREATILLSTFIGSVSRNQDLFVRCMAMLKKHHTLALLSVLRRHHVQGVMDLRQVVEAASSAAYALAHPEADYIDPDTGLLMNPQKVSERSYKWIGRAFPTQSANFKAIKDELSETGSHFNLVNSGRIVAEEPEAGFWKTEFFDLSDQHLQEVDLWRLIHVALAAMQLVVEVGKVHSGFRVAADFEGRANILAGDWKRLGERLMATPRHQEASAKAADAQAKKDAARAARAQTEATRRAGK